MKGGIIIQFTVYVYIFLEIKTVTRIRLFARKKLAFLSFEINNHHQLIILGGIFGFGELLEKLADKNDPEHDESTNWLEECGYHNYDPAHFVPSDVVFDDPAVRQ